MSDNSIQSIPGESAFIHNGKRYEVLAPPNTDISQTAKSFIENGKKHAQVYRLDDAQGRFKYEGQWFKVSYLSGSSTKKSLADKPDAHRLIEEVATSFIKGVTANNVDLSQVAKATLQLGKESQGEMKYFKPEGLASKTPNWTYKTGEHFKQITELLHNQVDYLNVKKSYVRGESPSHIEGVCGYKNAGNTCFAGAALTEMRAMYFGQENAPEIYTKQRNKKPINSQDVIKCINDNWKVYEERQEDTVEFRDGLIQNNNTLRLPVNIFERYLKIDVSEIRREHILGLFAPKEEEEPETFANVRAALLKIFQSEQLSREDILDFIKKNRLLPLEEEELNAYVQQAQLAHPKANIPDSMDDWSTVDHLSFALYKLRLHTPGKKAIQPLPSPYGELSNSHVNCTLTPKKYKTDNTLQELVDQSKIGETIALDQQMNLNRDPPKFIPLSILRENGGGQKTYHPVLLPDQNTVQIGNETYEVCGFTRHIGQNAHSGHYIGYTLLEDDSWVECNDDKVRKLTQEKVQNLSKQTIRTLLLRRIPNDDE